jgi:hypothetical protein
MQINVNFRHTLDDALARAVTIIGLSAIALIHLLQVPEAFGEIGYLGALFIAVAVAGVLLAAALTRSSDSSLWLCAGGLGALILLGYLLSRSVGLPGWTGDVGEWDSVLGLGSMVVESLVICVSAATLATRHEWARGVAPHPVVG